MSYDIYLVVDTGGPEPAIVYEVGNHTSNTTRIWAEAMGKPMNELDGMDADIADGYVERGIRELRYHPERFKEWEPENGWGTVESAKDFLWSLLMGCRLHPRSKVRVSR